MVLNDEVKPHHRESREQPAHPRHDHHGARAGRTRAEPDARQAAGVAGSHGRRGPAQRGAALWSGLLLAGYWWAAGGGFQNLTGWDTALTSLGRLTGLVASVLLLVQVLLMARFPVLEHAFGQDELPARTGS